MKINNLELTITEGTLEEAFALKEVLTEALQGKANLSGISLGSDVMNTEIGGDNIGALLDMVMSVATSPKVRACLLTLCERCAIGKGAEKTKVSMEFFEPVKNRKHYYPVMMEVAKANLLPFFQGLNLGSYIQNALKEKTPPLK